MSIFDLTLIHLVNIFQQDETSAAIRQLQNVKEGERRGTNVCLQ